MSSEQIQNTMFDCKLCGEKITFNVEDPSSFLSVADEKKFAGMTLSTYRVSHVNDDEGHTNAVTVDHKGYWRGYVDAYVDLEVKKKAIDLYYLNERIRALNSSSNFEFLILLDLLNGWVLDIVCPKSLLPLKIAESILENVSSIDTNLLEDGMIVKLDIAIGDKTFRTYVLGDLSIIFILKSNQKESLVDELFEGLFASESIKNPKKINPDTLKTAIQIIDKFQNEVLKVDNLLRVIEEGADKNLLKLNDPSRIPQLVKSVVTQKSYPEYLSIALISLLRGQKTILELIETGYLNDFQIMFEIVDFVSVRV